MEQKLIALAREIAFDLKPLSQILKELSITGEQYNTIAASNVFKHILSQEIANWGSALNTQERIKLKTQSMIEMSLEEFHARMHDPKEPLSSKVELAKLIAKLGGIDQSKQEAVAGERFQVTINLGADQKLVIDKPAPTHKVIDGEVL
jgi:hypothetical protein